MIMAKKVRLFPTKEQEQQMWKSANVARWAYNWALDKQIKHFEATGKLSKISDQNLRKELTPLKQTEEYKWLFDVSNNVTKQAIKDLCSAIDRFHDESKKHGYKYRLSAIKKNEKLTFRDFEDFPRFKKKGKSKVSFYNDTEKLKVFKDEVHLEKIGRVKIKEKIPINCKYSNPRVSFDGKYWYLTVGIEASESNEPLNNFSIGIDVGIKNLAVTSIEEFKFSNINKTKKLKKLEKKLKRLKRKVSNKYEKNKKGGSYQKTSNIKRLERQIKLVFRKLNGIRKNHLHQATNKIVKTKPSKVVMETLNIKGMMKNKHLSKAIQQQGLYEFKRQIIYKCEFNGIEFVEADKWYPSSKTCSHCGNVKNNLSLSERIYICEECGCVIDRDYNAAINLSRYSA